MRLKFLLLFVALVAASALAACGRERTAPSIAPTFDLKIPIASLSDVLSYADQVSVVTVVDEEILPPSRGIRETGEGFADRRVTLRFERTLWVAPNKQELTGQLVKRSLAGFYHDGQLRRFPGLVEVGRRYLVPLAYFEDDDDGWGFLTPTPPPLDEDGRMPRKIPKGERWAAGLAGMTMDEVAALLASMEPDPLAVKYADLPPVARFKAVQSGRAATAAAATAAAR